MNLGELIDRLKAPLEEYFGEKVNAVNKKHGEIVERLDGLKNVGDKVENIPSSLEKNFGDVHTNINRTFVKTDEIHKKIGENLDGKISAIPATLDEKFNTVEKNILGKVNEILEIYHEKVSILEKKAETVPGLELQIKNLDETVKNQAGKISALEGEKNSLENEKSSLKNSLFEKENALETAQGNLRTAEEKFSVAEKSLQVWENAVEIYRPVRVALNNCETFKNFVEGRGLNDDSDAGLFIFVQELGKTIDFIRDIHQTASDVKKAQGAAPKLMTAEEMAVYEALNKCYRNIWRIDFDVFTTPGSRKNISAFEKTDFNKDEAIFLKDMRNKSLKYTQGIYVPMLLTREGKMYKQAYVEAGNM